MELPLAYLDPGSGSMIVSLIMGGLAAAGVAIKLWWNKILRFLRIKKAQPTTANTVQQAAAPAPETPASPPAGATATAPAPEPDAAGR